MRGRERAFDRSNRGYEVSRAAGLVMSHLHPVEGLGKICASRVGLEFLKDQVQGEADVEGTRESLKESTVTNCFFKMTVNDFTIRGVCFKVA